MMNGKQKRKMNLNCVQHFEIGQHSLVWSYSFGIKMNGIRENYVHGDHGPTYRQDRNPNEQQLQIYALIKQFIRN